MSERVERELSEATTSQAGGCRSSGLVSSKCWTLFRGAVQGSSDRQERERELHAFLTFTRHSGRRLSLIHSFKCWSDACTRNRMSLRIQT